MDKEENNHGDVCEVKPGSFWERLQNENSFPLVAMLCVSERCLMRCAHCYQNDRSAKDELELGEIERLLDQLLDLGTFRFSITGGEPCLRDDLLRIIDAAWARRFLVSLKTTAALLDVDDVGELREHGLSGMSVSLYHDDPKKHDAFVGHTGAWERAVAALTEFHKLGGISTVSSVLMNWNYDAVAGLKKLCVDNGWEFIIDSKVYHANDGRNDAVTLRATGNGQIEGFKLLENAGQPRPRPQPENQVCLAGVTSVYIKPNGDVWLCPILPVSIGNIREMPLADIWRESAFRQRVTEAKWGDNAECMSCEQNRFCQRCPGEAYQEHGDLTVPATVDCEVARVHAAIFAEQGADEDPV